MPVTTEKEAYCGVGEATSERDKDFPFTFAIDANTPADRELLGGKGASMVEMRRWGLSVPPGFNISTEACQAYYEAGDSLPREIWDEVLDRMVLLEEETGLRFGDPQRPLIVSSRSGARNSMPGVLTSVLNVGLNKDTVLGVAELEGEWCAWDSLARAHQSYGVGVLRMKPEDFNAVIAQFQTKYGAATRQDLPLEALKEAVKEYEKTVALPQNPYDHLRQAIASVFDSWNRPEAVAYREEHGLSHDGGTAVNIVKMVFGNKPQDGFAGAGVLFTHHPDTGENRPYVAYIAGVQGTDIVGPESIHQLVPLDTLPSTVSKPLADDYQVLTQNCPRPQESEWTHNGKINWLQTRDARLSPRAEFETLFAPYRELVKNHILSTDEAVEAFLRKVAIPTALSSERLNPDSVRLAELQGRVIGRGIPIAPGIGFGVAVDSIAQAEKLNALEEPASAVLTRESPAQLDLARLPPNVVGCVTRLGGAASHAAQTYRNARLPVIFGFPAFDTLSPGTEVNMDGYTGLIIGGGKLGVIKQYAHLPLEVAAHLQEIQDELEANPWLGATYYPEEWQYQYEALAEETAATLLKLQERWQSPKALAVGLLEQMIPPEDRLLTMILPQENVEEIRAALHHWLDQEHDVSLRTCHAPEAKMGVAPWQAFSNYAQIDDFFTNDGYSLWQKDPALSEVVVGRNPKGKLDPELVEQHCVFSVSATTGGAIVQIIPRTPQTRDWDAVDPNDIITIRAPVDLGASWRLGQIETQLGDKLKDDELSEQFADLVSKTVFGRWWKPPFVLPNRMAALAQIAQINTLEGQARIYPNGRSWIKIFGAKGARA